MPIMPKIMLLLGLLSAAIYVHTLCTHTHIMHFTVLLLEYTGMPKYMIDDCIKDLVHSIMKNENTVCHKLIISH